jgi:hypothetical protein
MREFDFVKGVIEDDRMYCVSAAGDIYEMSAPERIDAHNCPNSVIRKFLSKIDMLTGIP